MADIKKYYYLKLKDNFYDSDAMIILESMENGYLYSNILMKMYLRSLKTDGRLMLNDRIPYNSQMLSKIVGHNKDVVEKAIQIFKELDLIEILDNGAIYMLDIQNYIGKSSDDADRKRIYRDRIKSEKLAIGQMSTECPDKTPPEIEIDIEKDIDINNIYPQNTSKNTSNEVTNDELFDRFWHHYPKKIDKKNARKSFDKIKPDEELVEDMIWQLERFKDTKDWKSENGKYIPYPSTWLNGRRWEDEFETDTEREERVDREILEGNYGT